MAAASVIAINPAKLYRNPVFEAEARGRWVPLLTAATNFFWHLAKTAPTTHVEWKKRAWGVFKAQRDAGAYRDSDLSAAAEQALADVLLTAAPVTNPRTWLQIQLDEYAKAGNVFGGSDPKATLAQWVEIGKSAPAPTPAAGGTPAPSTVTASGASSGIGWVLLGAGLYLLWRGRK